jgi:dTDP-4-amino-4,6-dideoxygalactose transaminase
MEVIDERVKARRNNFYFYKEQLANFDGITFMEEPDKDYYSNHWLTAILLDPNQIGVTPSAMQKEMDGMNIESRVSWKPMHLQPVFANCPAYLNGTAEKIFNQGLCLPSGSNMSIEELEYVTCSLFRALSGSTKLRARRSSPVFVPVQADFNLRTAHN